MLKTISSITNALGALNYKGTWNALTNSPALADGTGAKGDYYVTSTAGTQTFGGLLLFFGVGDWIVYNGAVWQRVEGGSDGNFANITLNSTDAGASAAPLLDLYRDSATPAASDTLGEIEFNGEDSAGNKQQYALIHASILSPTSGSETGQLHFETATGGASTEKMIIGTTNLVINEIGAIFNVRIEGDADANLLFTDATNDRVGVGTISPSTKLQVNGTVTATGVADSGLTSGRVTFASSGGLLADNANLVWDNTNSRLGIGTATPNDLLEVYGGNIRLRSTSNGVNGFLTFVNTSGVVASNIYNYNGILSFNEQILINNSTGIVTMGAYGAGAATFSAAGVISSVSDETWKTKDGVPTNPDVMLQKLEPGYWFYNEEKAPIFGQDRQLGFYAQNVHEAIGAEAAPIPEKYKDEDGNDTDVSKPWGYYDRSVLAITVMSLKNALNTIEELKQRITALENK
tara:strand:- start:3988 stop:5370 length:1383 start_codon:yes stop_codon:yes gene_type:complete